MKFKYFATLLFVTLSTPNYPKFLQIKRRYSIIHSDEYYVRLFYPVPSVIISKSLSTKEAGTSPTKVWFPASPHTIGMPMDCKTMITIFVEENNPLTPDFYSNLINSLPFHRLTCTCGHSACLSIHGYYTRSLKTPEGKVTFRICGLSAPAVTVPMHFFLLLWFPIHRYPWRNI